MATSNNLGYGRYYGPMVKSYKENGWVADYFQYCCVVEQMVLDSIGYYDSLYTSRLRQKGCPIMPVLLDGWIGFPSDYLLGSVTHRQDEDPAETLDRYLTKRYEFNADVRLRGQPYSISLDPYRYDPPVKVVQERFLCCLQFLD